jgi:phenylacetic acid degradation operon negative regulatory protein
MNIEIEDIGQETSGDATHTRAQHLLITALGDYWWCRPEHIPSTGLVRVMMEFGVRPDGTRSALSRLTRRDLLTRSQQGRHTFYGLTPRTIQIMQEGAERIFSFGTNERSWDGTWSAIAFSIPEKERTLRHVLRTRLRWLTFGPLYDGLWISPHQKLDAAKHLLEELSIETATLFSARMLPGFPRPEELVHTWDLEDLSQKYERYIEQYIPLQARVRAGKVSPDEAMVMRTRVMDAWRQFPQEDPDLPPQFLPPDWPRDKAHALCMNIYSTLQPAAAQRFQQLISKGCL